MTEHLKSVHVNKRAPAFRKARVCYDHLAGEFGVMVYDFLVERGALAVAGDAVVLTEIGRGVMRALGVDIAALERKRRPCCRNCLDVSERRPHLAGALGAALLARFEELGWAKRVAGSRVIEFSADGEFELRAWMAGASHVASDAMIL